MIGRPPAGEIQFKSDPLGAGLGVCILHRSAKRNLIPRRLEIHVEATVVRSRITLITVHVGDQFRDRPQQLRSDGNKH